jgi:glycosyltransferase involved in cell wall biosynthesis
MIEVVIPARDAARFLRAAVESVAAQSRPPARVTVVDDRSTDGTGELARALAAALAGRFEMRVLANAGPQGPAAARNTALRAEGPPLVALLDADDLLEPHHHATLAALMRPGRALAFGDCTLFDDATGAVAVPSHHAHSGLDRAAAEPDGEGGFRLPGAFGAILWGSVVATSASLVARDAACAAGLFDEAMLYCEDAHLFLRLAARGEVAFTRAVVARKRRHAHNLSHDDNDLGFRRAEAVLVGKLLGRLPSAAAPAGGLGLGPGEIAALEAALPRRLNGALHEASRHGLGAYAEAFALCRALGRTGLALRPRHLARLLVRGVLGLR